MSAWLSIRRWRDYQHYTDRNPPWIKWHISTLDDHELNNFCTATRLFWSVLLLVAAKKENCIPNDTAWLAREVSMPKRAVAQAVKELVQAEFILEFDSKAACIAADTNARKNASPSRARARARSETEAERDLEGLSASNGSKTTRTPEPPEPRAPARPHFIENSEPCVLCERVKGHAAYHAGQWWCEECFDHYWAKQEVA